VKTKLIKNILTVNLLLIFFNAFAVQEQDDTLYDSFVTQNKFISMSFTQDVFISTSSNGVTNFKISSNEACKFIPFDGNWDERINRRIKRDQKLIINSVKATPFKSDFEFQKVIIEFKNDKVKLECDLGTGPSGIQYRFYNLKRHFIEPFRNLYGIEFKVADASHDIIDILK
jgi:hypothetical protein